MKQGKFIVIEGLDGSGSSSQSRSTTDFLNLNGISTYLTKEPTDNVIGGLIRGALTGIFKLPSEAMQFLFSADRSHHIQRVIEPKLKQGIWVVCDRYLWSSIAFGSLDLDKDWLINMQERFPKPDITIFIKADPKECVRRITKDRFDNELFEEVDKLAKVWNTYEWLAKKYPSITKIIDGNKSEKEVFESIVKVIRPLMIPYFVN